MPVKSHWQRNQIHNFLRPKYKGNTAIENFRIGQPEDNLRLIAGSGYLKGVEIDLCQSRSYLDVFVSEIALQLSATQSVDVLVYDLLQNKLLDTITIDCLPIGFRLPIPGIFFCPLLGV